MLAIAAALPAQERFYLRDNDTVVFYGDSITEQKLYTTFVETFVVTRFPRMKVRFVHSGWGGDRVGGGVGGPIDERLQRDVIAYKPTVMTIMLGMNDGGYKVSDEETFRSYREGMAHIVQAMKKAVPELRITLIEPSPYDDVTKEPGFPDGYNSVLVQYGQFLKELGQRNQMAVADLNGPVVEALRKANALNPEGAKALLPDRVHPAAGGHLLMAECLLKAWGATPLVSAVEIDAGAKQVKKAENTAVTGLAVNGIISWSEKDAVLPMPVTARALAPSQAPRRSVAAATVRLALESSDFMEALNQQTLQVHGLQAPKYTLKINGAVVGSYGREEFDKGLNLAGLPTPMASQAASVHQLTLRRTSLHELRWRQLQMAFRNDNLPRVPTIIENLDALDEDLAVRQRAAAQPAACYYELIPE